MYVGRRLKVKSAFFPFLAVLTIIRKAVGFRGSDNITKITDLTFYFCLCWNIDITVRGGVGLVTSCKWKFE